MDIYSTNHVYYVYAYMREDGSPYYIGKAPNKGKGSILLKALIRAQAKLLEANRTT